MSKLYTEEQVIDFTMSMISQYEFGNKDIWSKERLKESLDNLTPIELPSDEEIDERAERNISPYSFIDGVNWVLDKIKKDKA